MTTPNEVGIRVRLYDEASRPMGVVRREVQQTGATVGAAGTHARTAAADYTKLATAAARAGESFGARAGGLAANLLVANRQTSLLSTGLGRLGLGYAAYQAVKWGVQSVAAIDDQKGAFEGLLDSQSKAQAMYADIGKIKSPFGTSGLEGSAQSLLANSVAADQVVSSVQAIADAVSKVRGGSAGLTAVTGVLGQIHESTVVSASDLAQLQSRGLQAYQILGAARGLSGDQFRRGVQSGQLRISGAKAYDELIAGFEAQARGSAANTHSLSGSFSLLADSAAKSLNTSLAPHLPEITHFIDTAAAELPGIAKASQPFFSALGNTLQFMADHPHLTEGLAAFLVFREIAGPALRTVGALYDMGKALNTIKSSEEVLLLLRSLGGLPAGLPGMPGTPRTTPTVPPIVVPPRGGTSILTQVEADAAAAVAGARFGVRAVGKLGAGILKVGRFAEHTFAGNPGIIDRANPNIASKDAALAQQLQEAQKKLGFPADLSPFTNAKPGVFGSRVSFDAPAARSALKLLQAESVALHVNVTTAGTNAEDIHKAAVAALSSPEGRAKLQAAIDASEAAARRRGGKGTP